METHTHSLPSASPTSTLSHRHHALPTPPSASLSSASKRPHAHTNGDDHIPKRIKTALAPAPAPEEASLYSDNVRRKLATTTRTGQACDRCKERKMKCDPDPVACQPCRQKTLKCYTTDRVTGQSRERGQSDRAENEVGWLRDQLALYRRKYPALSTDIPSSPYTYAAFPSPIAGSGPGPGPGPVSVPVPVPVVMHDRHPHPNTTASLAVSRLDSESLQSTMTHPDLPSPRYLGWPTPDHHGVLHKGPVEGTKADILDWGIIDSGAFDCDIMREPLNDQIDFFNFSTTSVLKTIDQRQKIPEKDLHLPPKDEVLAMADVFLTVMWGFVPVVHKPSFRLLINRLFTNPDHVLLAEKIQVIQMLAILNHQNAIRNHAQATKINDSYRYLHYSLGFFPDLLKDPSLPAMQALAMILINFRNMPKPGHTWRLAQSMLIKCIDLNYHRDPDKIDLLPKERNPLAKELRKRVFHAILGICISTGCRLGRPAPWQFVQWDVPLPTPLQDSEISVEGINSDLCGRCDFWQCLHLAKLLPLLTELHKYILSVRRSHSDYLKIVDTLQIKIDAWRADWDACTAREDKNNAHWIIATLLIDTWAAEFILNLHHPTVCTARTSDILERNLEICHKATKRMLSNFHKLSRQYKAADFTWHSIVAYTLGFGLTLHIYRRRSGAMSQEQFSAMKNELAGWISLMAYADLVLRTDNLLQKRFTPLIEQVQRETFDRVVQLSQPDEQPHRSPFHSTDSYQPNFGLTPKHEPRLYGTPEARSLQDFPAVTNGHVLHTGPQHSPAQNYEHITSFPLPHSSVSPASYSMYSPPVLQYPNLPTSLAPLLNEIPPSSVVQYQNPSISVQDPTMIFSPHLYTDATSVWPLVPEGQFAS